MQNNKRHCIFVLSINNNNKTTYIMKATQHLQIANVKYSDLKSFVFNNFCKDAENNSFVYTKEEAAAYYVSLIYAKHGGYLKLDSVPEDKLNECLKDLISPIDFELFNSLFCDIVNINTHTFYIRKVEFN